MLRLSKIEQERVFLRPDEPPPEPAIIMTFAGPAGEFAHCEITVTMKDRGSDIATLRAAEVVVRDAVVLLAHEIQTKDVPQSSPKPP